MIGTLQGDAQALVDSVISLCYFMRGGATYSEMMNMSPGQRDRIRRFVDQRLEEESKSMHPVY